MSGIEPMQRTIHVIGLSVAADARLSGPAAQALLASHSVIGSKRQLALASAMLSDSNAAQLVLPKLAELKALIDGLPVGDICILASGDPLYFGIGRWLGQQFDPDYLHFYAAVSSIQAVCNRLGFAQQDCTVVSFHGRDLAGIKRVLKRNNRLIVLTDKRSDPISLAKACIEAGFDQSRMWVCEELGSEQERYRQFAVTQLVDDAAFHCAELHVSVIEVQGKGGVLPEFPGIPDYSFASDRGRGKGMFTKRETRLEIVTLLQPASGDLIWDIGAGCGGVATELSYWNDRVQLYAIEQHPERLACLHENQRRFGTVSNLHIVDGRAPEVLAQLPDANKVFIGGSDGELNEILNAVWQRLPEHGVLVASSVTEKSQEILTDFALAHRDAEPESLQISVGRGLFGENEINYQAKLPVTLFKLVKPGRST